MIRAGVWARAAAGLALGDRDADRVVPPTGPTIWLAATAAAGTAFLAVPAMALALAAGRVAGGPAPAVADAAQALGALGWAALAATALVAAAAIALAAQASVAANAHTIRVLRLVGARDAYVIRAFARRVTLRVLAGATLGAALGALAVAALPDAAPAGAQIASGATWAWAAAVPPLTGAAALLATRRAAARALDRTE